MKNLHRRRLALGENHCHKIFSSSLNQLHGFVGARSSKVATREGKIFTLPSNTVFQIQ